MSEDSFISVYNDRINFQTSSDLYDNCHKLQNDVTILRKKNIELEGELVQLKNLNSIVDRKYQRALQDVEHYKMRNIIEKKTNMEDFNESMDVEYGNIYSINEENIKKYLSTEVKNCELEQQCKHLETTNYDLKHELETVTIKYDNLKEAHDELKSFIEEKKAELLEISQLKLRMHELEASQTGNDSCASDIYLTSSKIDELQVKCYKLENENVKYKENHMNLLLLMEENTSLTSKIERLEERLTETDNKSVLQSIGNVGLTINTDKLSERKVRHLERENEILKSEQAQLLEKNSKFVAQINQTSEKLSTLEQRDTMVHGLIDQWNERVELLTNRLHNVTRECDSYKKVLFLFSEQSPTDGDVAALLESLHALYDSIECHKRTSEYQSNVLDRLAKTAASRLEKFDSHSSRQSTFVVDETSANDRRTIIELRQQLEQLHQELDNARATMENCSRIDDESVDHTMEEAQLSPRHYSELGFCRGSGN